MAPHQRTTHILSAIFAALRAPTNQEDGDDDPGQGEGEGDGDPGEEPNPPAGDEDSDDYLERRAALFARTDEGYQ